MADKKNLLDIQELNLGKNEVSMSELEKLAEQGDQAAMHKLIKIYSPAPTMASNQPERNPTQAFKWVKKLGELGDWQARHWLANCYFIGEHVEKKDWDKAIALLEQNATEGDVLAWIRLAYYYSHGNGVEKDFSKAIEWLKKIVEFEDSSKISLNSPFQIKQAQGKPNDFCREFNYFYEEPRYKLADCYFQGGNGIEKNLIEAVEWLKKAIKCPGKPYDKNCRAELKLGECYLQGGYGLEQNFTKAVEWFEKAAGRLDSPILSIHGDRQQFTSNGNQLAQRKLGFYYLKDENYAEAVKWFEEAVYSQKMRYGILCGEEKEDNRAKTELGICYYHAKDYESASNTFNRLDLIWKMNDCFGQLWLAYFIYRKNKPAAEKISPFERLNYSGYPTATGVGKLSPSEREIEKQRYENVRSVRESENRIAELLHKAAFGLFFSDEETNSEYLDIVSFAFPDDVICFLEHQNSSPAKIILAFYYRYKNESQKFLDLLNQAAYENDIISKYQLGIHFKNSGPCEQALEYFNKVENTFETKYGEDIKNRLVHSAIKEISKIEQDVERLKYENRRLESEIKEKEALHKALYEKEKEMLSFFTHTMRNALATAPESLRQAIHLLGSEVYEKDTKHYQAINKIAALFSTLSLTDCLIDTFKQSISDPQEFKKSWQNDHIGEATPNWVIASALRQSLNRIIFMSDTSDLRKLLISPETALIKATRKSFIEEVLPLNVDIRGVDVFYKWTLKHIPAIEVSIADSDKLNFGVNQIRFSLLFAITSELILNALKYWNGENRIQISWQLAEHDNYVFSVKNHCKANATSNLAGTHKGLAFIKRLVELLGNQAQFACKSEEQLFTAELILNKALFEES
jgi:TPR repeat protein